MEGYKPSYKNIGLEKVRQIQLIFMLMVKDRYRRQRIRHLTDSAGNNVEEPDDLGNATVDYFTKLFTNEPVTDMESILNRIPILETAADNDMLLSILDMKEIKDAVWSLNPNSAAGPDGYNGYFFRICWNILKQDIICAVLEFFLGIPPSQAMLSSVITLLPKKQRPDTYADFRRICLSNFISKVTTRMIATQLSTLLPSIISAEQIGFLKGHDISEHVLMANEMVHLIDKKTRGANVMIKLDMAKAFDRVNWCYLENILRKFGFHDRFITIILNSMHLSKLSVAVNGKSYGFYSPTPG